MNILFYLNRYPGAGGIETMTTVLSKLFATELGLRISIFSVNGQEGFDQAKPLWINELFIASNHKETDYIDHFEKFMENNKFDIVIFQDSYADVQEPLLKAKSKYGFKLITCEHNTPDCHLIEYRNRWKGHSWTALKGLTRKLAYPYVYTKMLRRIGNRHKRLVDASDAYVLLSDAYKAILRKYWSINSPKISAIPNIKNDFGCTPFDISKKSKKKQALFVGRLTPNKGIKYLLDAWTLIEHENSDWTLKIVGDGELRGYVEEQIKNRKLQKVSVEGFRNDVEKYYMESQILLMTSIFEGLPMVLIEGMQFGVVPIVFNSFGAAADIISDGADGCLVKPYDLQAFAKTFLSLVNRRDFSAMQRCAVEKSKKFTPESVLSKWENLLRNFE